MSEVSQKSAKRSGGIAPVLAAIAIQVTLGVAYIWSVFQKGIAESIFGGNETGASLAFTLLLLMMTVGSAVGGVLVTKFSTQKVVFAGGLILAGGFFFSSLVTAEVSWLLWVTYGLMGGIGMGFAYSPTIACAQKWYPHKRGLITGIIVASLGLGGVVFSPIVAQMIESFGGETKGEPGAFRVLSLIFAVVISICSFFLKSPHGADKANIAAATKAVYKKQYTPKEMLKTPQYFLMLFSFMLACIGGVMMINFARQIAIGKGLEEWAIIGVMVVTLCNSAGRLTWGAVSDKLGRHKTIVVLLSGSVVLSLLVNSVNGIWVFALIACIGLFYGGIFSNFPALTADLFGVKHVGANYGLVLLGFGAGSVIAGQIGGHFANIAKVTVTNEVTGVTSTIINVSEMFPAFVIASCCSATALVLMFVLNSISKKSAAKEKSEKD